MYNRPMPFRVFYVPRFNWFKTTGLIDAVICVIIIRRTRIFMAVIIIKIIHTFSIALFPAERAQRACSHTCT